MHESTHEQDYIGLFRDAEDKHVAVGEGSTLYLCSAKAIEEALRWNPEMKFVFMLRSPAEVAYAYHMQMVFHEFENIVDFSGGLAIDGASP